MIKTKRRKTTTTRSYNNKKNEQLGLDLEDPKVENTTASSSIIVEDNPLPLLLQAIDSRWPLDKVRPGLVLSYLGNKSDDKKYYGAICRYPTNYTIKEVEYKVMASTLYEVVESLSYWMINNTSILDRLSSSLKKKG